jgi:uncharacterized membrane protein
MQNTSEHERVQEQEFSWEITAHDIHERTPVFYASIFGITILLLAFCIWQRNFLFGIFVLMATGTILFLSTQHNEEHLFTLTEQSLIIGDGESELPYKGMSHYDIYEFASDDHEILFMFRDHLKQMLRIRIHSQDAATIDAILSRHVKRKPIEPTLLDIVSKIIGI